MDCSKQLISWVTAPVLVHLCIEVEWAGKALLGYAQVLLQGLHQWRWCGPVIFHVHSPLGASYARALLVSEEQSVHFLLKRCWFQAGNQVSTPGDGAVIVIFEYLESVWACCANTPSIRPITACCSILYVLLVSSFQNCPDFYAVV